MLNNKGKLNTFTIDFTAASGEQYNGTFTSRKMSILDNAKVQRRKSELCGGMYCVRDDNGKPTGQGIDEMTEWYNYLIALLEVTLIQKPAWWDLEMLSDEDLLAKVYEEVMKFENSFRRRRGDQTEVNESAGSGEGVGTVERQEANNSDNSPKVVDGQVSAALDL